MSPRRALGIAAILAIFLTSACNHKIALSPERKIYAGTWIAPNGDSVTIRPDGSGDLQVAGAQVANGGVAFTGTGLTIELFGVGTTFLVSQPPMQEGDRWTMRLNGVTYTRK